MVSILIRFDVRTTNVVVLIAPANYALANSLHHTRCLFNLLCSCHNSCHKIFLIFYCNPVNQTIHTNPQ